jgi:hypothetical protein
MGASAMISRKGWWLVVLAFVAAVGVHECSSGGNPLGPSTSTVGPTSPSIALSTTAVTLTMKASDSASPPQTVGVTNSGGGTLSELAIGPIGYGSGPSGWLTVTVSPTTAPATVTLTATVPQGVPYVLPATFSATVPVTSSATGVTNSPQTIMATLTVLSNAAPVIALTPGSVTFSAAAGGSNPISQTVAVKNSGGSTLSGLAIGTISYGSGATGWLAASLSATTAPATVTLTPALGSLAVGTYTATVPVSASATGVTNSPQTISVTFTVSAALEAPTIALGKTAVTFSDTAGGGTPVPQTVAVTNGGSGTLSGLAIGTISYGSGASGWLAATLSGTTAPVTVTLTPTTGNWPAGTSYTATVPVSSSATGVTNSPQTISITVVVGGTTVVIKNELIFNVLVTLNNGTTFTVAAQGTNARNFYPNLSTLMVSYSSEAPYGDPMGGNWATITNPSGSDTFVVNNYIGTQEYFAPLFTNEGGSGLYMAVFAGTTEQIACDVVVPSGAVGQAIGYFKLYTNTEVRGYDAASGFQNVGTGPYVYWDYSAFASSIATGSGTVHLVTSTTLTSRDRAGSAGGVGSQ